MKLQKLDVLRKKCAFKQSSNSAKERLKVDDLFLIDTKNFFEEQKDFTRR